VSKREWLSAALEREAATWSAKTYHALAEELRDVAAYERTDEGGAYQVEVQLLERTADYVHVLVSVDDGGWRAFVPVSSSFIVHRDGRLER